MTIRKKDVLKLLLILIPILPDYFRLFGQPVYQYVAILLFVLVINRRPISRKEINFIAIFFATVGIFAVIPRVCFMEAKPILSFLVIPLLLSVGGYYYIETDDDVEDLIDALIISSMVICLLSFVEYLVHFNFFSLIENVDLGEIGTSSKDRDGVIRLESSFGTAIAYGIYLCVINTLCLYKITAGKGRRSIYFASYFLSAVALIFTRSRMPMLTFALVHGIYIFKFRSEIRVFIVAALSIVFLIDCLTSQAILGTIKEYFDLIVAVITKDVTQLDINSAYRVLLPSAILPEIAKSPIVGMGQKFTDNFTFHVWAFEFDSIDNFYLAMLLKYGIFGLIGQLIPFVASIYWGVKMRFESYIFPICLSFAVYLINLGSVYQMSEARLVYLLVPLVMWKYQNRGDMLDV